MKTSPILSPRPFSNDMNMTFAGKEEEEKKSWNLDDEDIDEFENNTENKSKQTAPKI